MHRDPELEAPGSAIQPSESTVLPHRIVIAGGSYGGTAVASCLLSLLDGKPVLGTKQEELDIRPARPLEITLIDERDGFFHTVGAPLAHVAQSYVESFWKKYSSFQEFQRPEIKLIRASVQEVDPKKKTITYQEKDKEDGKVLSQSYDYLVSATGLRREWPVVPQTGVREEYIKDATGHIESIKKAKEHGVIVIGGGAVGIEFAGEIKNHNPDIEVTLIHSRNELLSNEPLPSEFKQKTAQVLEEEGVKVVLGQRPIVEKLEDGTSKITFKDGTETKAGFVLMGATKVLPSTNFLPAEALDDQGYVKIRGSMNLDTPIANQESHFAIGDIAAWSGIRRAGAAIAMGKIAALNIYSDILMSADSSLTLKKAEFPQVDAVMGLAVGKQALTYGGPGSEVKAGEDQMEYLFGHDLGWTRTLKYMGLSDITDEFEKIKLNDE